MDWTSCGASWRRRANILQAEFPRLPFLWLDTEESEGEVFALAAKDLKKGR